MQTRLDSGRYLWQIDGTSVEGMQLIGESYFDYGGVPEVSFMQLCCLSGPGVPVDIGNSSGLRKEHGLLSVCYKSNAYNAGFTVQELQQSFQPIYGYGAMVIPTRSVIDADNQGLMYFRAKWFTAGIVWRALMLELNPRP